MPVTRTCEWCQKSYSTPPSAKPRFCCIACWYASRQPTPATYNCLNCGKKFTRVAQKGENPQYCTVQCRLAHIKPPPSKPAVTETRICDECGKSFIAKPCRTTKFCSRACSDKGREISHTAMETMQCRFCGKSFERAANWKSKSNRKEYCSRACGFKGRRLNDKPIYCRKCGNEFRTRPGMRARPYCSRECYIEYKLAHYPYHLHKANTNLYGLNWFEQRETRRQMDNYRCQNCDTHEHDLGHQLDVHHVIPFRTSGIERYEEANRLSNLVSLCASCHKQLENNPETCFFLAIRNLR